MQPLALIIDGQERVTSQTRDIRSPFDQSLVTIACEGDERDALNAIQAARAAFDSQIGRAHV